MRRHQSSQPREVGAGQLSGVHPPPGHLWQPSADLIASLDPSEFRLVINLLRLAAVATQLSRMKPACWPAGESPTWLSRLSFGNRITGIFSLFSSALNSVGNSRVWIHCQFAIGLRYSLFSTMSSMKEQILTRPTGG